MGERGTHLREMNYLVFCKYFNISLCFRKKLRICVLFLSFRREKDLIMNGWMSRR